MSKLSILEVMESHPDIELYIQYDAPHLRIIVAGIKHTNSKVIHAEKVIDKMEIDAVSSDKDDLLIQVIDEIVYEIRKQT